MTELEAALRQHVDMFNAAVRSGQWTDFVATFSDDAVMMFVDVPSGPYVGRDAIIDAYRQNPPDDTMTVTEVREEAPDSASAVFRWDHGGPGTMTIRWFDGQVAELTVAFDEAARAEV